MKKYDTIKLLTLFTNRSENQTLFLLNLVEDWNILIDLEWVLYNDSGISYCPSTIEEVEEILKRRPKSIRVEKVFFNNFKKLI